MSGAIDFFQKENPIGKAMNPVSSAVGIKYGSAKDDPEHLKRKQAAEEQRATQVLAEQKRQHAEELAEPENVRKRALASAASLGESGRRRSASQYLSGI